MDAWSSLKHLSEHLLLFSESFEWCVSQSTLLLNVDLECRLVEGTGLLGLAFFFLIFLSFSSSVIVRISIVVRQCHNALCDLNCIVITGSNQSLRLWCQPRRDLHSFWHLQAKTRLALHSRHRCGGGHRVCWRQCICFQGIPVLMISILT